MKKDTEEAKNHVSAADVIVATAKQSGLLDAVAEALCFIDKHRVNGHEEKGGITCALYADLAEAFDDHVCLPAIMIEGFYSDGIAVGPYTEAELAPYLA
jgi:hypothetical protein